jgi:hypothetical protein
MDKKDTIVTDVVIQALKMDDTIKRQEVIIERLKSDNNELHLIISRLKELLNRYVPESVEQMDLLGI